MPLPSFIGFAFFMPRLMPAKFQLDGGRNGKAPEELGISLRLLGQPPPGGRAGGGPVGEMGNSYE
jgi:hypothetical protein